MTRKKALFIFGRLGVEFHSFKGVLAEAERQARKILGTSKVVILDVCPRDNLQGFYVLVKDGGSRFPGCVGKDGEGSK